jgi:hypothetical protein
MGSGRYVSCNYFHQKWGLQPGTALKTYNILLQTLRWYLKKHELTTPKLVRKTEMGIETGNEFERYLILRQECGFGLTRCELRVLAFNFM